VTEHLTEDQLECFRSRLLSPDELLAADDHLSVCDECRSRLARDTELKAAIHSLRKEIESVENEASRHPHREELLAFMNNELSDVDREIVGSHLDGCSLCREQIDALRADGFNYGRGDD